MTPPEGRGSAAGVTVSHEPRGRTRQGEAVDAYRLDSGAGVTVELITYGAAVSSVKAPDLRGRRAEVVLGYDDVAGYEAAENPYMGATCGRYANRIAGGRFELDGEVFTVPATDGPHALHGGVDGFHRRIWQAEPADGGVRMWRTSPHGEEGFPGELQVEVRFTLDARGALTIRYRAATDRPTVVNLTNHSYFNLAGDGDILGHTVQVAAARYAVVDEEAIPTGELRSVRGLPLDLRQARPVGQGIRQLPAGGFDHNLCLDGGGGALALAARVSDPRSGRTLTCHTTAPGLQLYTGNFLDGVPGRHGTALPRHAGLCLEAQHYPDSPNRPGFPSTVLRPGEVYRQTCVYSFGLDRDISSAPE